MLVQDYPISTPFGAVKGYPLNPIPDKPGYGFHNGIDYACPTGTPLVVNGVTIALTNNTGASTGSHCHVGKYVNGQVQDPGVGNGFQFNSAVVYDTGQDATNGIYVRITGDGALWNYLHLEKVLVTKGQVLKGGNMPLTQGQQDRLIKGMLGRDPTAQELSNQDWANDPGLAIETLWNNGGQQRYQNPPQPVINKQVVQDYISKNLK